MTQKDEPIGSLPRQTLVLPRTVEGRRCLLMFSGGRDSTLAAVRLDQAGRNLTLVTITSDHLVGIDRVKRRLDELAKQTRQPIRWLNIRQPLDLATDTSFYERTCLPCHHAYVVASGVVAKSLGIEHLAFGYAAYQSGWPEQSTLATARLREVLLRHGITLELPVYDINTRDMALSELSKFGLSTQSMEQKCLSQVSNVTLDTVRLRAQIDLWERAIDLSMGRIDQITVEIVEDRMIEVVAQ